MRGPQGGPPRPRPKRPPGGDGNRGWPSGPIHGGRRRAIGRRGRSVGRGGRSLRRGGIGWNSTRSTSAAASPSIGATRCRIAADSRRGARGAARLDEHPVHAAPDVGGDALHAPADVDGALRRFAPRRVLERVDPGPVGDERDGAQRDHRQQQEGDDQPGTERHLPEQSTAAGTAGVRCSCTVRRKEHGSCHGDVLEWPCAARWSAWHASGFCSWDMSRRTGLVMVVALAALTMYPPPAQVGVRDPQAVPPRGVFRRAHAVGNPPTPADPGRAAAPAQAGAAPAAQPAVDPAGLRGRASGHAGRPRPPRRPRRRPVPSGTLPASRTVTIESEGSRDSPGFKGFTGFKVQRVRRAQRVRKRPGP